MLTKTLEILLYSLAYSFWPFLFILIIVYLANKYFNHGYNKSVEKKQRILGTNKDEVLPHIPDNTVSFKAPKIETSFGDQRIGQVYSAKPKD